MVSLLVFLFLLVLMCGIDELLLLMKAFDTLNHELLIAKLHVYGFNRDWFKLINDYLSYKWQRTKRNKNFSSWAELIQGVQESGIRDWALYFLTFTLMICFI